MRSRLKVLELEASRTFLSLQVVVLAFSTQTLITDICLGAGIGDVDAKLFGGYKIRAPD